MNLICPGCGAPVPTAGEVPITQRVACPACGQTFFPDRDGSWSRRNKVNGALVAAPVVLGALVVFGGLLLIGYAVYDSSPEPRPEEKVNRAANAWGPPESDGPAPRFAVVEVGLPAPGIEGVDSEGSSFKLSDYRGKVVVLDFWAVW